MQSLAVLETQLQQWRVPNDVQQAVLRAVDAVSRERVELVEAIVGDQVAVAVRGQPAALYVSPSRVSVALAPTDAERAHRSDSALGLDKESASTWIVHCRYGRLDSSRLSSMTALMVKGLRRHAPAPEPRQPVTRTRRRTTGSVGGSAAPSKPRSTGRRTEEDRLRAVEAAIPRCPVPGCNLPMVGGSCGFHD